MEWIVAILGVIAAAASATGTVMASNAQVKAADYNSEVAKKNAEAAAQQAAFDAQQIRDKNKRVLAAQRAAYSASGIDPDAGTALDVRADSAAQGEMDALVSIYTGASSANSMTARARLGQMEAKGARNAAHVSAHGTMLGARAQAVKTVAPTFKD